MKSSQLIFNCVLILIATALMISCATEPYAAKEDEEIYGTWVNTSYKYTMWGSKDYHHTLANYAQKIITKEDDTYEIYGSIIDMVPQFKFQYTITDKWTDSDSNIWYKIISKSTSEYSERTRFGLNKISNTGRTWEFIVSEDDYPSQIDLNHPEYRIYYLQEE